MRYKQRQMKEYKVGTLKIPLMHHSQSILIEHGYIPASRQNECLHLECCLPSSCEKVKLLWRAMCSLSTYRPISEVFDEVRYLEFSFNEVS